MYKCVQHKLTLLTTRANATSLKSRSSNSDQPSRPSLTSSISSLKQSPIKPATHTHPRHIHPIRHTRMEKTKLLARSHMSHPALRAHGQLNSHQR